MKNLPKGTALF